MDTRTLLIAIACGLGTALMLFAPSQFGSLGVSFAYVALVPLFVSVLGFGTIAGLVSALTAGLVMAVASGPSAAFAVFLVNFLPAVWIGHSAGLAQSDGETTHWFPLSDILFRLAIMSAVVTFVLAYFLGFDLNSVGALVKQATTQFYENSAQSGAVPDPEQLDQMANQIVNLMPIFLPVSILIMYVLNLSVGASIARSQGWMLRPKDDIPATTAMPLIGVIVFAIALGIAFLGGPLGLAARVFAGALGAAFMFVGLATMHYLTRNVAARGLILGLSYASMIILFFPTFLFAMLGLAETLLGLRAQRNSQSTN